MTSLDFTQVSLTNLITHFVGNKLRDEKFTLSSNSTEVGEKTEELLLKYFLISFKTEELYSFTHAVKLDSNEIFSEIQNIFSKPKRFIDCSQNIAKLLYEQSMHPMIKKGELNVAYFSNIVYGDELVDGIGIFKSESPIPFIKMINKKTQFSINHDYGFAAKGMDKGCLILNIDRDTGYKILAIDSSNKTDEAQYWTDNFLKLRPIKDEFHQTSQFLGMAKKFVTNQLEQEFEVSKTDKIDLLNRSVEYFKTHESFEKNEFERAVFKEPGMINSFRNFDKSYSADNQIESLDNFSISPHAVKKQAKVLKSILKLDKNFHIYIHGSSDLIQKGVDPDGKKFYKIYFDNES